MFELVKEERFMLKIEHLGMAEMTFPNRGFSVKGIYLEIVGEMGHT